LSISDNAGSVIMEKKEIFESLKNNMKLMSELNENAFDPDKSFKDMGVDSLDTVNIIFSTMRELKIKIQRVELPHSTPFNEVVEYFLARKKNEPQDK
jgi:acyl carrier protein